MKARLEAHSFRGATNHHLITICAAAILASIGWILWSDDSGVVGTNGVRPLAFVGVLGGGEEVCQTLGTAKRIPSAALVTVGLAGVAPQPLRIRLPGRRSASVVTRYGDGVVALPLPERLAPAPGQMLCIRNAGRKPVQLAGEKFASATLNGRSRPFALSFTLVGSQRTWGAQVSALLGRIGSAQAGAGGSASGWIVVGLSCAAAFFALGAAWRFAR